MIYAGFKKFSLIFSSIPLLSITRAYKNPKVVFNGVLSLCVKILLKPNLNFSIFLFSFFGERFKLTKAATKYDFLNHLKDFTCRRYESFCPVNLSISCAIIIYLSIYFDFLEYASINALMLSNTTGMDSNYSGKLFDMF